MRLYGLFTLPVEDAPEEGWSQDAVDVAVILRSRVMREIMGTDDWPMAFFGGIQKKD